MYSCRGDFVLMSFIELLLICEGIVDYSNPAHEVNEESITEVVFLIIWNSCSFRE